jgi:clostripain
MLYIYVYTYSKGFNSISYPFIYMKAKFFAIVVSMLFLVSALAIFPAAIADEGTTDEAEPAEWTFMVYLDADNNLDSAGVEDLSEMMEVGSTNDVNIIVLHDSSSDGDTYLLKVEAGKTDSLSAEWVDEEENMGDPETLIDFTTWSVENYPAERYLLVLWNHGGAFWGVCWDDTNHEDCIDMPELSYALGTIKENIGHNLDLIGFDACLMAQAAVQYEIMDYVDYCVASAYVEPGDGWPYAEILTSLTQNPGMSAPELGTIIVNHYIESYWNQQSGNGDPQDSIGVSQAVFNMSKMRIVAQKIDEFGMALAYGNGEVTYAKTYYAQILAARTRAQSYDMANIAMIDVSGYCMYDVIDFIDELERWAPVPYSAAADEAIALKAAVYDAIIHVRTTPPHDPANGGSVYGFDFYFPNGLDSQYSDKYDQTRFARDSYWDEFIHHYIDQSNPVNTPPTVFITEPKDEEVVYQYSSSFKLSGQAYDVQGTIIAVQVSVDGGEWEPASGTISWEYTIEVSNLEEGWHTATVKTTDGDMDSTTRTISFYIERTTETQVPKDVDYTIPAALGILAVGLVTLALWRKKQLG